MLSRGVVVEVNKRHIIVMTADGQFVRARLQGNPLVGEEIAFIPEASSSRRFARNYWYGGAAAVLLFFLIPLFLFVQKPHPVVAYLSMDVNPSIELGIDKEEKVRELRALNEDGRQVIQGIDYEGKPIGVIASVIMNRIVAANYINASHKDIVITSVMLDGSKVLEDFETSVTGVVNKMVKEALVQLSADGASANVTTLLAPAELREEAKENGISAGKMAVYLLAKDEGYNVDLEQFKEHSIDNVTEELGGVPAIVSNSPDASRESLKQLIQEERLAKSASAGGGKQSAEPEPTPTPTPTKSPAAAGKPSVSKPSKPAASPSGGHSSGAKETEKPAKPVKPATPSKPGGKDQTGQKFNSGGWTFPGRFGNGDDDKEDKNDNWKKDRDDDDREDDDNDNEWAGWSYGGGKYNGGEGNGGDRKGGNTGKRDEDNKHWGRGDVDDDDGDDDDRDGRDGRWNDGRRDSGQERDDGSRSRYDGGRDWSQSSSWVKGLLEQSNR